MTTIITAYRKRMSSRVRAWPVTAALAALLTITAGAGLTACGGGAKSNGEASKKGPQVATDAVDALRSASSVHMLGSVSNGGEQTKIDLTFKGDDTKGQITSQGKTVQIIKIGDKAYLKADQATWKALQGPAVAQLVGDRWLMESGKAASSFNDLTLKSLTSSITNTSKWSDKVEQTNVDSKKAVVITDTSDGSKLYVAATGKPYPLKAEEKGSESGQLTFSDYNKSVSITAPKNSIDITKLEQGSGSGSSPSPSS